MKTAVIGVGNLIFKDEGVGVYAQRYIEQNYTFEDDVTLVDGGVLGFHLMGYYQDYDKVLILDTITMDYEAGSVYNLPSEELLGLGSYKQTAHEVEVVEMLEICTMLDKMAEVNVIGIIPKDIQSVEIGLSDELKEKFPLFVDAAMDELKNSGIRFKKETQEHLLENVLLHYLEPTPF